jgi:hypothetical protein
MSRKFDTVLDDCMDLLRAGASVEDCLARYPEHAEELRPLLSLASAVKGIPTPRPDLASVDANRMRMLDAVQNTAALNRQRGPSMFGWLGTLVRGPQGRPLLRTALALAAVLILVSLSTAVLFASASDSLPGQTLYPVKRFSENVRLSVTLDAAARQDLRTEFRLERQREVGLVLESGQQATIEFRSTLDEIGDGYWIVGGLRVIVDGDAVVEGQVVVGAMVIVHASAPGDGTLRAIRLQVLADPALLTPVAADTPTPSATPTATPTPSLTPTATPTPTNTATVTATPSPTATATPTHTVEPQPTDHLDENETEEPDSSYRRNPDETEEPDEDEADEDDAHESESDDHPDTDGTEEPKSAVEPVFVQADASLRGQVLASSPLG